MSKLVRVCFCVVGVVSLRKFLHRASLDQKVSMYAFCSVLPNSSPSGSHRLPSQGLCVRMPFSTGSLAEPAVRRLRFCQLDS